MITLRGWRVHTGMGCPSEYCLLWLKNSYGMWKYLCSYSCCNILYSKFFHLFSFFYCISPVLFGVTGQVVQTSLWILLFEYFYENAMLINFFSFPLIERWMPKDCQLRKFEDWSLLWKEKIWLQEEMRTSCYLLVTHFYICTINGCYTKSTRLF